MIQYQFFPRSVGVTPEMEGVIQCFRNVEKQISSTDTKLSSDSVLKTVKSHLEQIGFTVEAGKKTSQKIKVPVLYGLNNRIDKYFNADAVSADGRTVLEIEAGRALDNFNFLKDIFEASMMSGVEFLVLVVRNQYRHSNDFQKIHVFLETMFISGRIVLPLKGILLIGY